MTTKMVRVSEKTWNRLRKLAKYGETMDDVIDRLLVRRDAKKERP